MRRLLPSTSSSPHEQILLLGIKAGLFLIFLSPLVISTYLSYFPAIAPPVLYLRFLIEIVLLLYLLLLLKNPEWRPAFSPIVASFFIFVLVVGISDIFGINPQRSLWSTIHRMEGFLLTAPLAALFLVLCGIMRKWEDWRNLFRWIVFISVIVGIVGILQQLGLSFFYGPSNVRAESLRIESSLGNPIFYGEYLLFVFFFSLFLAALEKRPSLKTLFGFIALWQIVLLFYTGTRAAWIGAAAGIIFILGILLLGPGKINQKQKKCILSGILIFLALFLFLLLGYTSKTLMLAPMERYLNSWTALFYQTDVRFGAWQIGLEAWKKRPVLGYGQESFSYIYETQWHPTEIAREFAPFDTAHNKMIDLLVESGLVGLLSYIAIFTSSFFILWKNRFKNYLLALFAAGAFLTYSIRGLFAFDGLQASFLLTVTFAFAHSFNAENKKNAALPDKKFPALNTKIRIFFTLLLCVATIFLIKIFVIEPARDQRIFRQMVLAADNGETAQSLFWLEKAAKYNAYMRREIYLQGMVVADFALRKPDEKMPRDLLLAESKKILFAAGNNLAAAKDYSPIKTGLVATRLAYDLSMENPLMLAESEKIVNGVRTLNPAMPQSYYLLGAIQFRKGRPKEGIELLKKAYGIDGNAARFFWTHGEILAENGEFEKAAILMKKGIITGNWWTADNGAISGLAEIYGRLAEYEKLASFYEEVLWRYEKDRKSSNPLLYAYLFATYRKIGDWEKARFTAERLERKYPDLQAAAQELISSLGKNDDKRVETP